MLNNKLSNIGSSALSLFLGVLLFNLFQLYFPNHLPSGNETKVYFFSKSDHTCNSFASEDHPNCPVDNEEDEDGDEDENGYESSASEPIHEISLSSSFIFSQDRLLCDPLTELNFPPPKSKVSSFF